jgi:hypothetical protein
VAVKFDSWKQAPCYDPVLNVGVLPCPQAFIDNLQLTRHNRSLPTFVILKLSCEIDLQLIKMNMTRILVLLSVAITL